MKTLRIETKASAIVTLYGLDIDFSCEGGACEFLDLI